MKFVSVYRNVNQISELQRILVNLSKVLVKYYTNT
jgi:hypothetical protein